MLTGIDSSQFDIDPSKGKQHTKDIKPANLLISENDVLKISDFGLARLYFPDEESRLYSPQVSTRWYRAPEILWGSQKYGPPVDMWAAGCVIAEMLRGVPLFAGTTDIEQLALVIRTLGTPRLTEWPELTSLPDYNKIRFPNAVGIYWDNLFPSYEVNEPDVNALKGIVAEIDIEVRKYNQTLQFVRHPLNSEEYLVFAMLIPNQACKFQPNYTDTERKFFYKLLETLANNEDYGIMWHNIYAVAKQLPPNAQHPLSKERIQDLENLWVSQGYFLPVEDKIYFGPRTMLEYGNYLKSNFSNLMNDCKLCNKIVYWDIKCSECDVKLHRECIRKYLVKKSICPNCKKIWNTRLS
ncbi:hypothetical protein DOY81_008864 [Sarcophaga bullata]|nr:hypothetical protein DOY81_008864 [Sarcophaga bullata]